MLLLMNEMVGTGSGGIFTEHVGDVCGGGGGVDDVDDTHNASGMKHRQ